MSIRVKYGTDTYAFASKNGDHYWFLVECERPSFSKCVGMIPSFEIRSNLYRIAVESGYTDFDFDQIRTMPPSKSRSSGSVKAYKPTRSARIVSDRKPPVRKSTLTNSVKLF